MGNVKICHMRLVSGVWDSHLLLETHFAWVSSAPKMVKASPLPQTGAAIHSDLHYMALSLLSFTQSLRTLRRTAPGGAVSREVPPLAPIETPSSWAGAELAHDHAHVK